MVAGAMALTNAEKQRRFQERNVVVLTRSAEDIAEKLMLMADQEKLRKVVAYLKDHLENPARDDVEKAIMLGTTGMTGPNGRTLSKKAALAAYRKSKTEPPATSSWRVEAVADGRRYKNGVRLGTQEEAEVYVRVYAPQQFFYGYETASVLQDEKSPPNCSIRMSRRGKATLVFREGECVLLDWKPVRERRGSP
jgi:hypothetical protein